VMMATHGRGPVRRLLLGSVTAKVLHDVDAAVWTAARASLTHEGPAHNPAQTPYRSILCALDDTNEAEVLLKASAALASAYQARLSLVHVVETPPAVPEVDFTPYNQEAIAAADVWLRELIGQLGLDATPGASYDAPYHGAPYVVLDGLVPDRVREEAVRRQADLIVTGRGRAQTRFSRMWSHLYQIVRESPCPVLSV